MHISQSQTKVGGKGRVKRRISPQSKVRKTGYNPSLMSTQNSSNDLLLYTQVEQIIRSPSLMINCSNPHLTQTLRKNKLSKSETSNYTDVLSVKSNPNTANPSQRLMNDKIKASDIITRQPSLNFSKLCKNIDYKFELYRTSKSKPKSLNKKDKNQQKCTKQVKTQESHNYYTHLSNSSAIKCVNNKTKKEAVILTEFSKVIPKEKRANLLYSQRGNAITPQSLILNTANLKTNSDIHKAREQSKQSNYKCNTSRETAVPKQKKIAGSANQIIAKAAIKHDYANNEMTSNSCNRLNTEEANDSERKIFLDTNHLNSKLNGIKSRMTCLLKQYKEMVYFLSTN